MVDFKRLKESMDQRKKTLGYDRTLAAFDCETTGAMLFHGDLPFMVCMTFEDKTQYTWEWPVDPTTRIPQYDPNDLLEIVGLLNDPVYLWIGHNIKFDTRCIEKAVQQLEKDADVWDGVIQFDPVAFLKRSHDTHSMSHAYDNLGSHGLKDLAVRLLDIPEDDVAILKEQVEIARIYGKQQNWKIASASNCPSQKRAPVDGWWVVDMWMPAAVYADCQNVVDYRNHPEDDEVCPSEDVPFDNCCQRYCLRDTERTLLLFFLLRKELEDQGLWSQYLINQDILSVTYKMEAYGFSLHMDTVLSEQKRLRGIAAECLRDACTVIQYRDINLNAPEQIAQALKHRFGVVPKRITKRGKATVSKDELETLYSKYQDTLAETQADKILLETEDANGTKIAKFVPRDQIQNLLSFLLSVMSYKKCLKAADGDLAGYHKIALPYASADEAPEYYIHNSINIVGTDTTRMSWTGVVNVSKGKNPFIEELKDLDLSLRKVFGPTVGRKWYCIDYKQLQVVIAAITSGEQVLIDAIERGEDLHEFVQRQLCLNLQLEFNAADDGQRTLAKACNFGYLFGAGPSKIDKTTHTSGLYYVLTELFPQAHEQIKKDINQVKERGYIKSSGYKLHIPGDAPYAATVYKIQGWEGIIAKRAMRLCDNYIDELNAADYDCHLVLVNHDELIFDVPEDTHDSVLSNICDLMEYAALQEGIPATVDAKIVTTNWSEGKKYIR